MGARGYAPTPVVDRVLAKVVVDQDGCWIFTGYCSKRTGYGQVFNSKIPGTKRTVNSHKVMWESQHGPVPDGLELDHLCRVPACCNPAHLEPVPHLVNLRRGAGRGMDLWSGQ